MSRYRICFYNELSDSTGHEHHVCQREIEVATETGEESAIAEAIRQFEQLERVSSWRLHAQKIECAPLDVRNA